jgi:hypothetical protein
MKVEDRGVHHKKYDGYCMKQRVKNSKGHLNITHFREKVHMLSIFCKASLMKNDVKVKLPKKIPNILIPSDGVVNWDGVLKSSGKPESNHAKHFLGWIKRPITHNSI